jgi:hypothetical protein
MMRLFHNFRFSLALAILICCALLLTGCNMFSSGAKSNNSSSNAYSISGTITPAASAAGATVKLTGAAAASATVNSAGQYTFSGLSAGTYTVTPSKAAVTFTPASQSVTVSADTGNINFTSNVQTFSISGSITPVSFGSGATVTLSGAGTAVVTADADGNFTFPDLANGSYTVTPSRTGFNFTPANHGATVNGADVSGVDFSSLFVGNCTTGGGSANFYVATYGDDSWSGTLDCPNEQNTDGPFASIARAQEAVRSIHVNAGAAITVMVRNGTYYLPLSPTDAGTLNFTNSDSGSSSAPIIWENYPGETPVLSGGLPVTGWTNVSGALWQAPMPAGTLPFEYLYYNGERRLRSRLQSSDGVGYYMHDGSCISTQSSDSVTMPTCNLGTFLRVAATVPPTGANADCPSVSDGQGDSKCLDRFQYNPDDPVTHWINLNPPKDNPCKAPASGNYPNGDVELTLIDAWTVDAMRVSCVDTSTHIIYLTGATQGSSSSYAYFGPEAGHRYMIENARDAFNSEQSTGQTGIWFLDRSTNPWTLNYLANPGENPNTDTVVIPQLGATIPGQPATDYAGASLLFANGLQYVTFSGLTFEVDNFIPSDTGLNNDANEEFAVPQTVDCESCQNVVFDGVTVRHTSGSAILIAGTGRNSGAPAANDTIENSAFYDVGASGIRIGHTPSGGDRPQYVAQFINVQNNLVQGYSRVFVDGEGVSMGNGHDVTFQHNDITDGYHAGMSICNNGCPSFQWSANGINLVAEYNHIWNVMQGVTSDGGALYYDVGDQDGSGSGDQILNNLIHDVTDAVIVDAGVSGSGYGGHGIYLDIQSSGVDVEYNVVYRVASGGMIMTEGPAANEPANTFHNNIVAYARKAMFEEQNPWPENCTNNLRANITNNIFNFDLNETQGFHAVVSCSDSCGMPFNQFQNFQGNLYWRMDGSFASDPDAFSVMTDPPPPNEASQCLDQQNPPLTMLTFSQWQTAQPMINGKPIPLDEDDAGTASINPGFGTSGQSSDFLLPTSPIGGFDNTLTNDTINTAGRTNPVITAPNIPATFPNYSYSVF